MQWTLKNRTLVTSFTPLVPCDGQPQALATHRESGDPKPKTWWKSLSAGKAGLGIRTIRTLEAESLHITDETTGGCWLTWSTSQAPQRQSEDWQTVSGIQVLALEKRLFLP